MGCTSSSPEVVTSVNIDGLLERAKYQGKQKMKLLLLGAGESGKSTILKQMRVIHGPSWTDEELRMYGVIVRSNVMVATCKLCKQLRALGLDQQLIKERAPRWSSVTPKQAFDELVALLVDKTSKGVDDDSISYNGCDDWVGHSVHAGPAMNKDARQFLQHWKSIRVLMETKTMKEVWSHHTAVNVIDGHAEYLQDLTRIASSTYCPTTRDILLARGRTTQVVMERYNIEGIEFEMYDVGGQRALRHKWLDCFDHVDAVIFVAALSGYDQTLVESRRGQNRMVEALELFRAVCNHRAFQKSAIMLFLNKKDIFAEKILHNHISSQGPFKDYDGPLRDFNAGVQYFIDKFLECVLDHKRKVFLHVTCATDTKNMEFVLDSTRTIVMAENLKVSFCLGDD